MSPRRRLAAALLGCACASAHAALWGYVDARGVAHFAADAHDARYRLVLADRGDGGHDAAPRVPGKADDPDSLLLRLQIDPGAKALTPWLHEAAREQGVDAELLEAVIATESGFDASAVSPRGAIGLMQITADTADRYATARERRTPARARLLDPRTNIRTGARVLADLIRRFGHIDLALAAWNAGEGTVRRYGGMPPIAETQAHVQMVLELYWALLQRAQARSAVGLQVR